MRFVPVRTTRTQYASVSVLFVVELDERGPVSTTYSTVTGAVATLARVTGMFTVPTLSNPAALPLEKATVCALVSLSSR